MSRIIDLAVPSDINELLLKGELTPDFRIFTAAASADAELPRVHMIGSSTEKDLQGDTMTVNALADMCKIAPMLSVFMNHEYDLPGQLFGSIIEPPTLVQQNGVADLHLEVEVETTNPAAMQTLGYIRNGRRLGCSVGCMVTKYEVADEDDGDNWFWMPIIIHGVYVVEFSVVGIPANQRSWVDNAIKGAFAHTLDYRLAPAVKSLWGSDFRKIVNRVSDTSLRQKLLDVPERPGGDKHIDWSPASKSFVLNNNGKQKTLESSTVVAEYLHKHQYGHIPPAPTVKTSEGTEDLDEQKAVGGNTSLPLMDIGTEWTGSKAEKEIFAQAEDSDGNIQLSKAKPGFLYYDPDNADKRGGYKMPFCYADGGLKIVPLGVRACANVLSGGRGGGDFDGGDDAMKAKVKTMYGRINSKFNPDPAWEVPWEKEDKAVEGDFVFIDGKCYKWLGDGSFLVSKSDGLTEEKELEIADDGSHAKFTGTHSHKHSAFGDQGDDDMHSHDHSHDNDANHRHSHTEKSAEPDVKAEGCNCCEACTGKKGCTCCEQCTLTDKKSAEPETYHLADAVILLLGHYNSIGKSLGVPEVTAEHVVKGIHPAITKEVDMQSIVTCVSAIDQLSDALEEKVDYLMMELGIPDYDSGEGEEGEGDEEYPATPYMYSLAERFLKRGIALLNKEGREFSTENLATLQLVHDAINTMTEGKVCGARGNANTSNQENGESVADATSDANAAMGRQELTESFERFNQSVESLTKSTEAVTAIFKLLEQIKDVPTLLNEVNKATTVFNHIKRDTAKTFEEVQAATEIVRKLKAMPLGRPTHMTRTVEASALANTVTYTQLADIENSVQRGLNAPQSEEEALAFTTIVKEVLRDGQTLTYREWPVAARNRPPLNNFQRTLMSPLDMVAYNQGGVARVPLDSNEQARIERQSA